MNLTIIDLHRIEHVCPGDREVPGLNPTLAQFFLGSKAPLDEGVYWNLERAGLIFLAAQ